MKIMESYQHFECFEVYASTIFEMIVKFPKYIRVQKVKQLFDLMSHIEQTAIIKMHPILSIKPQEPD